MTTPALHIVRPFLIAILCLFPALSCGEPEQGAVSGAADGPDTAAPATTGADAPSPIPADTTTAPSGTTDAPGPMIHPQRDPSAAGEDASGTMPADTATWTIDGTAASARADAPPLPVLTALRTGTHPGYARMTVEIGPAASGPPGYRVGYVDRPLIECGSGNQIFPVGDAWLEVRLEPAAAHTEGGQPTLGAREIEVAGPLLLRVYRTCDFEGIVTLVMALASPNPYRVLTLADPWRIVVDVQGLAR